MKSRNEKSVNACRTRKDARARTNQERQDQEEYGRDISEQRENQLALVLKTNVALAVNLIDRWNKTPKREFFWI